MMADELPRFEGLLEKAADRPRRLDRFGAPVRGRATGAGRRGGRSREEEAQRQREAERERRFTEIGRTRDPSIHEGEGR